jgi:hypothetical protein
MELKFSLKYSQDPPLNPITSQVNPLETLNNIAARQTFYNKVGFSGD